MARSSKLPFALVTLSLVACGPGEGGDGSGDTGSTGEATTSAVDTLDSNTSPDTNETNPMSTTSDGTTTAEGTTSDGTASDGTTSGGTTSEGDGTSTSASTGAAESGGSSSSTGGSALGCDSADDEDFDMDGWSTAEGDCNDCDPNVNPGAIEVIVTEPDENGMVPEPADENCDGLIDNVPEPCDAMLALDTADPYDAARALGLCALSGGPGEYGLVSANWVRADGMIIMGGSVQHGVLSQFGPNVSPLEGAALLGLSTGAARIPGQPGACGSLTCTGTGPGTPPPGFPQDVPGCEGGTAINDDYALEVTLRAPSNATGYRFSFDFYSFEYPEWVCSAYNDQFITLVNPPPMGAINGNIAFDAMANPVSVNIAFFDVCQGCPLGTSELVGTGFDVWDDAGATSWLTTQAPIDGGTEFTIRFAIWDTGDNAWDSTVLVDDFSWIADGSSVDVGTMPN